VKWRVSQNIVKGDVLNTRFLELLQNFLMKMLTILFDEFLCLGGPSAASLADSDSRCRSTDLITSLYISCTFSPIPPP